MYCPYCGAELPDGSEFCTLCGKKISHAHLRKALAEKDTVPDDSYSGDTGTAAPKRAENGFDQTKNGKSIASFVLAVLGLFIPVAGFICAVIALILGIVTLVKRQGTQWMAIVGIVISAIAIFETVTIFIIVATAAASFAALIL